MAVLQSNSKEFSTEVHLCLEDPIFYSILLFFLFGYLAAGAVNLFNHFLLKCDNGICKEKQCYVSDAEWRQYMNGFERAGHFDLMLGWLRSYGGCG